MMFSRAQGLIETDVLMDTRVAIFGVGSVGSTVSELLVQSGIGKIDLIDDDVLEEGNIMRHSAGVSDLGRPKAEAMKGRLLDKNPQAAVTAHVMEVSGKTADNSAKIVASADIVVAAFDRPTPRSIINALCVALDKPCVVAGVMPRACASQVLVVDPHQGPCYECFRNSLPEAARQTDPSRRPDRGTVAYTDVPNVAIEPGLAIDIGPVANLVARLVVVRAMRGRPSVLRSVDEDLSASLYLWVNRREAGSAFAAWNPMGKSVNRLSILRWYPLDLRRWPNCPCCGNEVAKLVVA